MCPRILTLSFFMLAALFARPEGGTSLSLEEDTELEKQLKLLNKPAIKSFKDIDGAIIDCVDINKQPALDHPLLQNHNIQLRPSSSPKVAPKGIPSKKIAHTGLQEERCPVGTVPIRRVQKKDLLRYKGLGKISKGINRPLDDPAPPASLHNAVLQTGGKYYGPRARLNVWGLDITQNLFSSSNIWIQNKQDTIEAGWTINPSIFGDSQTRLYISWTASNNQGCFNLLCQGFVQVTDKVALGGPITPLSVYNGPNYDIVIKVFKEPSEGNWWLIFGTPDNETAIGYWPKSLFTDLAESGSIFAWGGEAYSPNNEPAPPMGSGHFPDELFRKACYTMEIQLVDDHNILVDPEKFDIIQDNPNCYKALEVHVGTDPGKNLYFGGPGKCTN